MRPVYIHSVVCLDQTDPPFGTLLSPLEARRMGRLLKRALWCATKALEEASCPMPDAIITATDYGCLVNSEAFLGALKAGDIPRPTHFMQSTHNTIGSLLAIRLGCHGYNATYSHQGASWRSALADAWMQIGLGDVDSALVGWFDETTPALVETDLRAQDRAVAVVLKASPEGAVGLLEDPLTSEHLIGEA